MTSTLLSVSKVTAGYDSAVILHDVSVEVLRGSVTALLGSNGAGKTTLMKTIVGLLETRSGKIEFDGDDVSKIRSNLRVEHGIALVPEGRMIFPQLSVEENLRVGAFAPHARAHTTETLENMYQMFPRLKERRRQYGGTLSGGEQQMLAIGRGLMARPLILLLDEPTLGLGPIVADLIFETIIQLRSSGMTVLVAEQDVHRTLTVADFAYVLENGHSVMSGESQKLLADPDINTAYLGL